DGLGKFTAASVAGEVGITDGTLFRHFDSMEAVVNAAIDRLVERLNEGLPPEDPDPLRRLGAFLRHRFRMISTEPAILKLFFSDQLTQAAGKAGVEKIRRVQHGSMSFIRRCVSEAGNAGLLRPGPRPDELVTIIQGAVLGELLRFTYAGAAHPAPASRRGARLWKTLEALIRAEE
ncbi:TetR/AcrR family transcriptional regulator, partial [bacterium]|nr:TetR/AcrR family transcriptional regulator [bacterium]